MLCMIQKACLEISSLVNHNLTDLEETDLLVVLDDDGSTDCITQLVSSLQEFCPYTALHWAVGIVLLRLFFAYFSAET